MEQVRPVQVQPDTREGLGEVVAVPPNVRPNVQDQTAPAQHGRVPLRQDGTRQTRPHYANVVLRFRRHLSAEGQPSGVIPPQGPGPADGSRQRAGGGGQASLSSSSSSWREGEEGAGAKA